MSRLKSMSELYQPEALERHWTRGRVRGMHRAHLG